MTAARRMLTVTAAGRGLVARSQLLAGPPVVPDYADSASRRIASETAPVAALAGVSLSALVSDALRRVSSSGGETTWPDGDAAAERGAPAAHPAPGRRPPPTRAETEPRARRGLRVHAAGDGTRATRSHGAHSSPAAPGRADVTAAPGAEGAVFRPRARGFEEPPGAGVRAARPAQAAARARDHDRVLGAQESRPRSGPGPVADAAAAPAPLPGPASPSGTDGEPEPHLDGELGSLVRRWRLSRPEGTRPLLDAPPQESRHALAAGRPVPGPASPRPSAGQPPPPEPDGLRASAPAPISWEAPGYTPVSAPPTSPHVEGAGRDEPPPSWAGVSEGLEFALDELLRRDALTHGVDDLE